MKNPLVSMKLRAADIDSTLSMVASPVGGSFGRGVRSSGQRSHQGWDLLAPIGTPVFAVAPGSVVGVRNQGDYGLQVLIQFSSSKFPRQDLYAFYAHLSRADVKFGDEVFEGMTIGATGQTGNAGGTTPHLHFEIRTQAWPGTGLGGRIDPGEILGYQYYSCTP